MSDWKAEGLPPWHEVECIHARPQPCPRIHIDEYASHKAMRSAVETALSIVPGQRDLVFVDYAGRRVRQRVNLFLQHCTDVDHVSYAGWLPDALANPTEVSLRAHDGPDSGLRRHYFTAYRDEDSETHTFLAVVAAANGLILTAFRRRSKGALDATLRFGTLETKSY